MIDVAVVVRITMLNLLGLMVTESKLFHQATGFSHSICITVF